MLNRCLAGIIKAINIAAAGLFGAAATTGIIPGFHRNTDDFISLFVQHERNNSAVNPAAHCHQNLSLFHIQNFGKGKYYSCLSVNRNQITTFRRISWQDWKLGESV